MTREAQGTQVSPALHGQPAQSDGCGGGAAVGGGGEACSGELATGRASRRGWRTEPLPDPPSPGGSRGSPHE